MSCRSFYTASVICLAATWCSASFAAVAFDSAANSAYNDGWQTGDNGGSGFGPWTNTVDLGPTKGSLFIGSSASNGNAPSGNIDTSGKSFGLSAFSFATTYAIRDFSGGPLSIGDTFSIAMDNGFVNSGGSVGFMLGNNLDPYNFQAFQFLAPNALDYAVFDNDGLHDTGVPITNDGVTVAVTLTGADTYSVAINGTQTLTGTLRGANTDLSSVLIYNGNAGSGASHDVFFNSMAISSVPEASSMVLPGLLLLSLAGSAVRGRLKRVHAFA
jgi:hypothetical protein